MTGLCKLRAIWPVRNKPSTRMPGWYLYLVENGWFDVLRALMSHQYWQNANFCKWHYWLGWQSLFYFPHLATCCLSRLMLGVIYNVCMARFCGYCRKYRICQSKWMALHDFRYMKNYEYPQNSINVEHPFVWEKNHLRVGACMILCHMIRIVDSKFMINIS